MVCGGASSLFMKQAYGAVKSAKRSLRRRGVGKANRNPTIHVKKSTDMSMAHTKRALWRSGPLCVCKPFLRSFLLLLKEKRGPLCVFAKRGSVGAGMVQGGGVGCGAGRGIRSGYGPDMDTDLDTDLDTDTWVAVRLIY